MQVTYTGKHAIVNATSGCKVLSVCSPSILRAVMKLRLRYAFFYVFRVSKGNMYRLCLILYWILDRIYQHLICFPLLYNLYFQRQLGQNGLSPFWTRVYAKRLLDGKTCQFLFYIQRAIVASPILQSLLHAIFWYSSSVLPSVVFPYMEFSLNIQTTKCIFVPKIGTNQFKYTLICFNNGGWVANREHSDQTTAYYQGL